MSIIYGGGGYGRSNPEALRATVEHARQTQDLVTFMTEAGSMNVPWSDFEVTVRGLVTDREAVLPVLVTDYEGNEKSFCRASLAPMGGVSFMRMNEVGVAELEQSGVVQALTEALEQSMAELNGRG